MPFIDHELGPQLPKAGRQDHVAAPLLSKRLLSMCCSRIRMSSAGCAATRVPSWRACGHRSSWTRPRTRR